jgi:outer membrane protein assembly factor BamB
MKTFSILIILFVIFLTSCDQKKSEWGKWRGPNGDNVSTEKGWSADKLDSSNILWRKDIGSGHAAVITSGNRCYVAGWKEHITGADTTAATTLYCLNSSNGNQIWSFPIATAKRGWPGPRATPAIDGKNLYFLNEEGKLFCLDVISGKQNWKVDMAADSLAIVGDWGYCPSPVVAGDFVLLNLNKAGIALNKNTGDVVWNSNKKQGSFSSAKLFNFKGKSCGIFQSDSTLRIVDITNGNVEAAFSKMSPSTICNDVMLTNGGNIFASDEFIQISNGEMKSAWHNDTISTWFTTGVVIGDFAYQIASGRKKTRLVCIDLKTGVPKWDEGLVRFGQLSDVDNKLIIITGLGKVIIADASPEKFNKLAELQVLSSDDKQENWCWTAPTFCDGKLYVRNAKGELACINLR